MSQAMKLEEIYHSAVDKTVTLNNTANLLNWLNYCDFVMDRIKWKCLEISILDMWNFDEQVIQNLSQQDIINKINNYKDTR